MNMNNNAKAHQRSTQECDHASLKGCSQVLSFFTSAGDESGHTWYTKTSFFSSSSSSECTFSTPTAPPNHDAKKIVCLSLWERVTATRTTYNDEWPFYQDHEDHHNDGVGIGNDDPAEVGIQQQRGPFYYISLFSPFLPCQYVHSL